MPKGKAVAYLWQRHTYHRSTVTTGPHIEPQCFEVDMLFSKEQLIIQHILKN